MNLARTATTVDRADTVATSVALREGVGWGVHAALNGQHMQHIPTDRPHTSLSHLSTAVSANWSTVGTMPLRSGMRWAPIRDTTSDRE